MSVFDGVQFSNPDLDTKIAGLYDLEHTIGRGHYAVVKLARHVFTGEKVAVKVIDKTKLDAISRDHFFQEVICMKLVQHPNVVRLYEVIDTPMKLYLILELGDGGDLYDYIISHGNGLTENVAKRYFRQIVTAIAYCHKLRVVHRDLKPENVVFFEKLGLVKLTDFGFSNKFIPGRHLDTACGSLAYSAPEILLGDPYDAPKVDIWSLGVILYMLVCGRLPFQETNDSETITKIMDCDYSIPDYLSAECKSLIPRLLVRDPDKRAQLDDILQADWLRLDCDNLPIDLFSVPLISREHLSFEDHMEILTKMSEGKLATVDDIQSALERNDYNHITATYYLLAERKLKRNYIDEYKRLLGQSQVNEKSRNQEFIVQQQIADNSTKSGARISNQPVEERVRRFSMILEDEEEEEIIEDTKHARSIYCQYVATGLDLPVVVNMMNPVVADDVMANYRSCLAETSEEAMLEEEEEEFDTVAGLACVRSELLTDSMHSHALPLSTLELNHVFPSIGLVFGGISQKTTRSCSRTSYTGVDRSDSAESDVSASTNGSTNGLNSIHSSYLRIPFSTPMSHGESRRKYLHRRNMVPHRPLITVKSSPQLLKHIAEEEDWGNVSGRIFEQRKVNELDKSSTHNDVDHGPNLAKPFAFEDELITRSSQNTGNLYRNIRYVDDQLIGLRPARCTNLAGQYPYMSGSHSPSWTRRFFATPMPISRPLSVASSNMVIDSNLLNEIQHQNQLVSNNTQPQSLPRPYSSVSSPVENLGTPVSVQRRRRFSYLNSGNQNSWISRSQIADRRCSGPPGLLLAITGMYHFGHTVPFPSRSGSDTSFLDPSDQRPVLDPVTNSNELDKSKQKSTKSLQRICRLSYGKVNTWCSSTPMLYDKSTELYQSADASPSHLSIKAQQCAMLPTDSGTCSNTLREHFAPIREEDDDLARLGDSSLSITPSNLSQLLTDQLNDRDSFAHRRCSESSSLFVHSYLTDSSHMHHPMAELPKINFSRFPPSWHGSNTPHFNTSNVSLTSLATSLRDSRYMIDIIRGTFELQHHNQKRLTHSLAGMNQHQYHHNRNFNNNETSGQEHLFNRAASASTSVRSLTAVSDKYSCPTKLHHELELRKHYPNHCNPLASLSPESVNKLSALSSSSSSSSSTSQLSNNRTCLHYPRLRLKDDTFLSKMMNPDSGVHKKTRDPSKNCKSNFPTASKTDALSKSDQNRTTFPTTLSCLTDPPLASNRNECQRNTNGQAAIYHHTKSPLQYVQSNYPIIKNRNAHLDTNNTLTDSTIYGNGMNYVNSNTTTITTTTTNISGSNFRNDNLTHPSSSPNSNLITRQVLSHPTSNNNQVGSVPALPNNKICENNVLSHEFHKPRPRLICCTIF